MGVITYTHEVTTPVAPARMFKAMVLESDNLVPKLMPQVVKNIEIVEGDGGAGTIKQMNFVEGSPISHLKNKIHVVDDKNLVTKYSLIEGGVIGDKLESIYYDVKFEASGNGGCIVKDITEYHTNGDYVVTEADHKIGRDKGMELFKAVEEYLIANPSVYA